AGALADADRAIELDGTKSAMWSSRAMIHCDRGDLVRAQRDAEHAVAASPDSAISWSTLGKVRLRSGDAQGAAGACLRALELEPRGGNVFLTLICRGEALHALGDLEGAVADYEKAIALV